MQFNDKSHPASLSIVLQNCKDNPEIKRKTKLKVEESKLHHVFKQKLYFEDKWLKQFRINGVKELEL